MVTKDQEAGLKRLTEYWVRAQFMHDLLHGLMEGYDDDLEAVIADGHSSELMTYLLYWLSGLFVVVEGFNKLKLKDARVQKLFNSHLPLLKELRHETYHFTARPQAAGVIGQLNWAEELYEAIREHIREVVRKGTVQEEAQKFLQWRNQRQTRGRAER